MPNSTTSTANPDQPVAQLGPLTVADLLQATREFYTKKKRKWGRAALAKQDENGEVTFCVLGAMSAVMTNEEYLRSNAERGRTESYPTHLYKGFDLIYRTALYLGDTLPPFYAGDRGVWGRVYAYNDDHNRSQVLQALRKAEKMARHSGL